MLYDDNKIEKVNYMIYLKWFEEFVKEIPKSGFIYLDVTPEICLHRVLKRSRQGESIALEYLQKCNDYHNRWLKKREKCIILERRYRF